MTTVLKSRRTGEDLRERFLPEKIRPPMTEQDAALAKSIERGELEEIITAAICAVEGIPWVNRTKRQQARVSKLARKIMAEIYNHAFTKARLVTECRP